MRKFWSKLERADAQKAGQMVERDEDGDFYQRGYEHGFKGWPKLPPSGKQSKIDTYEMGYLAGQMVAKLKSGAGQAGA